MKKKTYILTLKSGDETIAERGFSAGDAPLEIGRSHSCALRTPGDDHSVSGHHARLFWKSGAPWIEDAGSRNGVYRNEKRISGAVRLEPGIIYGFGSCSLAVAIEDGRSAAKTQKHHQLRFVGGDRDGETVDICPSGEGSEAVFTIGLDSKCGLQLGDLMVSRHHASVIVHPGGDCHVRDENSRNGTYVNGEKLGTTPRLLKDGDKISIAYFDLQFLDRSKSHPDPHPLRKLFVLAAVAVIVAVGWYVWEYLVPRPTAADYRECAIRVAAQEDFARALSYMDSADTARNASTEAPQNDALRGQIVRWRDTCDAWRRVNELLGGENIRDARLLLGDMEGPGYAWTWNDTSAREACTNAVFYRLCVRALTDADEACGRLDGAIDAGTAVSERLAELDGFLANNAKRMAENAALAVVRKRMDALRVRLESIREGIARVTSALDGLDAVNPDFSPLVAAFEAIEADEKLPSSVRAYARLLLPTCRSFCETQGYLEKERDMIRDLDLATVRKGENALPLPVQDECARHARLSDARAAFQRRHETFQRVASILGPMVNALRTSGVRDGEKGATVAFATSRENWNKVLAFDCFGRPFPAASRTDPCGTYDEMLGIEFVYENLRELPKPPGRQNEAMLNFKPQAGLARSLFLQVQTFVQYMERPENAEFRAGKLAQLCALGADILADRAKLVADLKARSQDTAASERTRLVAGYYAEFFSPDPSYAALRGMEMAFKRLVKSMNVLAEEFENENDPEKHIQIRKNILSRGIPGMEIVRKCWAESEE